MFIDWINCLLEFTVYLLFFLCTSSNRPKPWTFILFYAIVGLFSYAYFIQNTTYILALNMGIFIMILCTVMRIHPLLHRITFAFSAFLFLLIAQFIAFSFLPESLLQSDYGNLIGNSLLVVVALTVYLFVSYMHYNNTIAAFLLRFHLAILFILVVFLILGQFYLSRLLSIWHLLPGIISLLALCFIMTAIIFYIGYQKSTDRLRAEILTRNMENSQAMVDAMRIQIHDFKHHLQYLQDMVLHAETLSAIQESIPSYIQDLSYDRSIYSILISINQPILRSALFGCYDRCLKNDIRFSLDSTPIIPTFPLKDYQLVEILENLFTNAIEHNQVLPVTDRYIHISLTVTNGTHAISVENPADNIEGPLEELYIAGHTSKQGAHQGLGLASISQIISAAHMKLDGIRDISGNRVIFSVIYDIGGGDL